jgi:hypothetical protein
MKQHNLPFSQSSKDSMQLSWHMVRQALAKLILWKVSFIMLKIKVEVLSPDVLNKYFNTLKTKAIVNKSSW